VWVCNLQSSCFATELYPSLLILMLCVVGPRSLRRWSGRGDTDKGVLSRNLKALLADYEKDDAVDWYFDRNYSSLADLGDYHRLVLKDVSVYAHTHNDD
jgi:hypothetical protein